MNMYEVRLFQNETAVELMDNNELVVRKILQTLNHKLKKLPEFYFKKKLLAQKSIINIVKQITEEHCLISLY